MAKPKQLTPRERYCIMERDNFTCQYCGVTAREAKLEIDHMVPISKGGTNEFTNLVTACVACNRGKGNNSYNVLNRSQSGYIKKYIEKKTKRVQLVFQPSIYKAAKDRAIELKMSLNEYLHCLIKSDMNDI